MRIPDDTDDVEQYRRLQECKARNEAVKEKMLICEKIPRDDNGTLITDHTVYKEMITFFNVLENDIFGGRVMVTKTHAHNVIQSSKDVVLDSDESRETDIE